MKTKMTESNEIDPTAASDGTSQLNQQSSQANGRTDALGGVLSSQATPRSTAAIRKEIGQVQAAIRNTQEQLASQMERRSKLYEELDAAMEEKYG